MWVTTTKNVEELKLAPASTFKAGLTHNLSHRLKALNSPLTWGYGRFPQLTGLVTTTTYNYIKTPVRFPVVVFRKNQLIKNKNLQSYSSEGRLTK